MMSSDTMIRVDDAAFESSAGDGPHVRVKQGGRLERLTRTWNTVRYYRSGQLVHRAMAVIRRRVQGRLPVDRYARRHPRNAEIVIGSAFDRIVSRRLQQRRADEHLERRVDNMRRGRWTFLNRTYELGTPVDWQSAQLGYASRLWQFQLQYHDWLLDLAAAEKEQNAADQAVEIWSHVLHWIASHSGRSEREAGDAWHPYCISRRIPAWLALWAWHAPQAPARDAVVASLTAQAAFLMRRLELDLGGNHLLENARALVLAGAACRSAEGDRWLDRGQRIIERELREQLLPHGEHFERSPMYHVQMTEALRDVADAAEALRPALAQACSEAVARMEQFATAISTPDGRFPLLGDASYDELPPPIRSSAENGTASSGIAATSESAGTARCTGDYWTYRGAGDFLVFDAGPVGPDHLPAHAHADLLTIEASFGQRRFIVDSGTYDYEDGAMRQYCRSTAAHNVLEIDGENQCDVWSRFRVGRRGWPSPLQYGSEPGICWASATHNAYRHLGVPTVGRWIGCSDEDWLIVDWAVGSGVHQLVNRLHLHPGVRVEQISETQLLLQREGVQRYLALLGSGALRIASGWYCPRFGTRLRSTVVEFHSQSQLPAALGWQLSRNPPPGRSELKIESGCVSVRWMQEASGRQLRISTRPGGA